MKFKYFIKVFKKTLYRKNIINGVLICGNKTEYIYIIKSNYAEKIFSSNFIKINYLNKFYNVNINHIDYNFINNVVKHFVLKCLPAKDLKIKIENNLSYCEKRLIMKDIKLYPRKILLNIVKFKKNIRYRDFNIKYYPKKIFFIKNELTNWIKPVN